MRALVLAAAVGCLALCPVPGAAQRPAAVPTCADSVPDGARVRIRLLIDGKRHAGQALGWGAGTPRVVTAKGDTVVVGPHDRREVGAGRTANRAWQGLIVGLLVGNLSNAPCFGERTCGEQNPIPFVTSIAGVLIGRNMRRERWVHVPDGPACARR